MKGNTGFIAMIIIVAFVSMIGPFSIDAYLPSFPSIEADLLSNRAMLSQTIAVYMSATAISTLFWGPLSDRLGRKYVIVGSLALYTLASLYCAIASNYSDFLLSRVFQGLAASGGMVAGRAMVRDVYDSRNAQRVMSYVLMLFALAPAIAPILGGWLHQLFGWRSVFYFLSLYGLTMLLMSSVMVRESLQNSDRQSFHTLHVLRIYLRLIFHLKFIAIVLALGSGFAGLFIYIAGAPTLLFDVMKLGSTDFWLLFVPITTGIILGSFVSARMIKRLSTEKLINISFIIMFAGMIINIIQAYYLVSTMFVVVLPIVIYAFGVALCMPGLSIMAIDCLPGNKGSASALMSFMQIMFSGLVAGLLIPTISADLMEFAVSQMVLVVIAILLWNLSGVSRKATA